MARAGADVGGFLLAIDQGTTSTRSIVFTADMAVVASAQREFPQHFPVSGWVEHDPEDLWSTALSTARDALAKAGIGPDGIAALGIANQRETALVWERASGRPIHPAIVWQDRRTADACARLREDGADALVSSRSGLVIDPYFSATKIAWMLDAVPGAREAAERGDLAFGTVDTWLLWRLTDGQVHATDATNAARTMLFDIRRGGWDDELLRLFRVPRALLPVVRDCADDFGTTAPGHFGGPIAIRALVGDQQSATVGQACFAPGMVKSTFGTGSFILLNTGSEPVASRSRLLTTIAYQLGGKRTYALEGSIFVAGAAVQWLRDGLGLLGSAAASGPMAAEADESQDVILVPAFVGLGAPHWAPNSRGALFGLTRSTGPRELARAALESVCFQTADLLDAMRADWPEAGHHRAVLRVDGGMVASDWTMQRLADLLDAPVDRPATAETTALGAAYLAGLAAGLCPAPDDVAPLWRLERRFEPAMEDNRRAARLAAWRDAVARVIR